MIHQDGDFDEAWYIIIYIYICMEPLTHSLTHSFTHTHSYFHRAAWEASFFSTIAPSSNHRATSDIPSEMDLAFVAVDVTGSETAVAVAIAAGDASMVDLVVTANEELLTDDKPRSTRHIELAVSSSGATLKYQAGDHLGVWPVNVSSEVGL